MSWFEPVQFSSVCSGSVQLRRWVGSEGLGGGSVLWSKQLTVSSADSLMRFFPCVGGLLFWKLLTVRNVLFGFKAPCSPVQLSSAQYSSIPRPHLLPTACLGTPDRARAQREAHRSMGGAKKWASITCTQCAKALVYQHSSNTDLILECRASPLHASRASYPDHIDLKRNSSLKRAELN